MTHYESHDPPLSDDELKSLQWAISDDDSRLGPLWQRLLDGYRRAYGIGTQHPPAPLDVRYQGSAGGSALMGDVAEILAAEASHAELERRMSEAADAIPQEVLGHFGGDLAASIKQLCADLRHGAELERRARELVALVGRYRFGHSGIYVSPSRAEMEAMVSRADALAGLLEVKP